MYLMSSSKKSICSSERAGKVKFAQGLKQGVATDGALHPVTKRWTNLTCMAEGNQAGIGIAHQQQLQGPGTLTGASETQASLLPQTGTFANPNHSLRCSRKLLFQGKSGGQANPCRGGASVIWEWRMQASSAIKTSSFRLIQARKPAIARCSHGQTVPWVHPAD